MDIIQYIKNSNAVILIGSETNPAEGKNISKWKSNIKLQAKRKDQRMSSSFSPQNSVQTATMEQGITNVPKTDGRKIIGGKVLENNTPLSIK